MGHQIIKTPDGTLAVFSSVVDDWIITNATPEDLLDYYANKAAEEARAATQRILVDVLRDNPRGVYYQFAMTFEEAQQRRTEVHGEAPWPLGGEGAVSDDI
jgi:hypothetical protein